MLFKAVVRLVSLTPGLCLLHSASHVTMLLYKLLPQGMLAINPEKLLHDASLANHPDAHTLCRIASDCEC